MKLVSADISLKVSAFFYFNKSSKNADEKLIGVFGDSSGLSQKCQKNRIDLWKALKTLNSCFQLGCLTVVLRACLSGGKKIRLEQSVFR